MNQPNPNISMDRPSDEERMMALLALTAQELPHVAPAPETAAQHSDVVKEAKFIALDADPVALEAYLRRGMRRQSSKHSLSQSSLLDSLFAWFAPSQVRWASVGVAVVLGIVGVLQWNASSLVAEVETGFASSKLSLPSQELVLPWERSANVQGFTGVRGNDTAQGKAFAAGLQRGRARLLGVDDLKRAEFDSATEPYVALGEWNVLLWSASESSTPSDTAFWEIQRVLSQKLADELPAGRTDAEAVHLSTAQTLLGEMACQPNPRTARQLAAELSRFREAFAPLEAGVLEPPP